MSSKRERAFSCSASMHAANVCSSRVSRTSFNPECCDAQPDTFTCLSWRVWRMVPFMTFSWTIPRKYAPRAPGWRAANVAMSPAFLKRS
eukprot:8364569-Lingulodinium_polyedra.AAC.1